ncbi:MAG: carboxypeptidase-like regulatory domain-containing protein [Planctomycetaceae bacterium]|nr:carboxypeptidase-like regulatory domain-containing protein [Planctomycetaceae bacterium]
MPRLYPATVTVMQDGKPLAGAEVFLLNLDTSVNWPVGAITNASGVAVLRTNGQYPGAPEGQYKVTVRKTEIPDLELPVEVPIDPAGRTEYNRIQQEIHNNTFDLVEEEFMRLAKTPLTLAITPNQLKLELDVSPAVRNKVTAGGSR